MEGSRLTRDEVAALLRGPAGSQVAVVVAPPSPAAGPPRSLSLERRPLPQPPLKQARTAARPCASCGCAPAQHALRWSRPLALPRECAPCQLHQAQLKQLPLAGRLHAPIPTPVASNGVFRRVTFRRIAAFKACPCDVNPHASRAVR